MMVRQRRKDVQNCSDRLQVLSDETRLSILNLLSAGPKSVSELYQTLKLNQNLVSHHLKILRIADLIQFKRKGRIVLYSLTKSVGKDFIELGCCKLLFAGLL